ncbi:MAG: T9SS type A sorting domain-containing protein [Chitinophagales bacterium]|nr:T9SS type A sorting domain-containing protein [Chitinophagales bacterium]
MKKQLLSFFLLLFAAIPLMAQDPCTSYAGGPYTDQGIDLAGCDGESVSAPYAAWLNEVYFSEVVAGGNYTFSICDGYSATAWGAPAVITVILNGEPASGTVTGGTVLATVEGCEVSFDVAEAGVAFFVISTANDCGGTVQQTDNGVPTITTNSGVPCVVVECADASAGTASGTADICFGQLTDMVVENVVIPNASANTSGFVWVVSLEDISGSASPNTETSFAGNFPILATPPAQALGFVNDGTQLPAGTYYFTPVVFDNATGGPAFADLALDPDCTFTGTSVAVTFYAENDPACDTGCPQVTVAVSDCEDGMFYANISTISMSNLTTFHVMDDQGNMTNITSTGLTQLGPYADGTTVNIAIASGDANCETTVTVTGVCPPACDIIIGGGFENGPETDWVEYEDPDQANFTIVTSADGAGVAAHSGDFLAWLGGYNDAVSNNLEQEVDFPSGGSGELRFYGWLAACGVPEDYFKVFVDDTEVFSLMGDSPDCGSDTYQEYTVDVSAYCDGGTHTLKFVVQENGGGDNPTNFFLDDVSLNACGTQCAAEAGTLGAPVVNGNTITASSNGYNTVSGYTQVYVLTGSTSPFNNPVISTTGVFTGLSNSTYIVTALNIATGDLATIQGATSLNEISTLISQGFICGDLSASSNTLSVIVGIQPNSNPNFQINNIVPMPVQAQANINFTNERNQTVQLTVMDITGRIIENRSVMAVQGKNNFVLSTANYTNGMYFVAIQDMNSIATAKFIKD